MIDMLFYFDVTTLKQAHTLFDQGCKNAVLDYKYATDQVIDVVYNSFERIIYSCNEEYPFEDYCNYLIENERRYSYALAYNKFNDADLTFQYFLKMKDLGIKRIIPVCQGNWIKNLNYIPKYAEYSDQIALTTEGMANTKNREEIELMHKKVAINFPNIKFHGIGIFGESILRIPYYSISNSTWIVSSKYKQLYYFDYYMKEIKNVLLTDRSMLELRKVYNLYPRVFDKHDSFENFTKSKTFMFNSTIELLFKPMSIYLNCFHDNFEGDPSDYSEMRWILGC